jgi:hypothetical protein
MKSLGVENIFCYTESFEKKKEKKKELKIVSFSNGNN